MRRVALLCAVILFFTSSFDIFLVLQAGGNYRLCQLASMVLIVLAAARVMRGEHPPAVLGGLSLLLWTAFQFVFLPVAGFWPKSLAYCLWLTMDAALLFAFVTLFSGSRAGLRFLLRWYARSFAAVASFGIVQFLLPLFGIDPPLVEQWWVEGQVARANGFSYEPSYFATYLLIGFVFVATLRRRQANYLSRREMIAIYGLTATGVVLSSSRMGILFLLLEIVSAQVAPWMRLARRLLQQRSLAGFAKPLWISALVIAAVFSTAVAGISGLANHPEIAVIVMNGTGLSDTAAHSVVQREGALEDTLTVFVNHPLVGRSLGGVSYAIGELHGDDVQSFEESKEFEGMNIFAEALAASGGIGFIPFLAFFFVTIYRPMQLARHSPKDTALLHALVRSLVFSLAILQFNQNLLRPYLWVHLALLAVTYANARQALQAPAAKRGRESCGNVPASANS